MATKKSNDPSIISSIPAAIADKTPPLSERSDMDKLLKSLRYMCSHCSMVNDTSRVPELVPNPAAVTRNSGLLALSVRDDYERPTRGGLKIERGDTIIVDPRVSYGPGDVLLMSDDDEFTVIEMSEDKRLSSLRDRDEEPSDWYGLVIGKIVELRKPVTYQGQSSIGLDSKAIN